MKAVGVLIIGLGLIMIVVGVQGTQSQILNDFKQINPKLRTTTGTTNQPETPVQRGGDTPGGPNPPVTIA